MSGAFLLSNCKVMPSVIPSGFCKCVDMFCVLRKPLNTAEKVSCQRAALSFCAPLLTSAAASIVAAKLTVKAWLC